MADKLKPRRTTPRWVKVFVIVTIVVVLVGVVVFLVSGGQHGPGRHLPDGGGGSTPSPGVTGGRGHTPPPGVDHGG